MIIITVRILILVYLPERQRNPANLMTHPCNKWSSLHTSPFGHISLHCYFLLPLVHLYHRRLDYFAHWPTTQPMILSVSLLATHLDFKAHIHNALTLGISYVYRPMYTAVDRIRIDPTSLSRSKARPCPDSGSITHTSFLVTSFLSLRSTPFPFELSSLVVAAPNAVASLHHPFIVCRFLLCRT